MKPDKLLTTGIPSRQQIESATPPESRRKQGAFVVIECFQEIPCDPCYHSCRFGAIKPFGSLNDIPHVDWDKCTGCGVCVAACPGLAIFVVDETLSDTQCLIAMPYEFLPLPQKGDPVYLLDRSGNKLGQGVAYRVVPGKKPQGTPVVWVSAPKQLSMEVRNLLPMGEAHELDQAAGAQESGQVAVDDKTQPDHHVPSGKIPADATPTGEPLAEKGGMNCVSC